MLLLHSSIEFLQAANAKDLLSKFDLEVCDVNRCCKWQIIITAYYMSDGQRLEKDLFQEAEGIDNDSNALYFAIRNEQFEAVQILINEGLCSPNGIIDDIVVENYFLFAARLQHLDIIKLLIDAGADLNLRNSDGALWSDLMTDKNKREEINDYITKKSSSHQHQLKN